MSPATVAERVAAGAEFLDQREPGWWQRIDLDRLEMRRSCACVLGQLSTDLTDDGREHWAEITERYGLRREWQSLPVPTDASYGFNAFSEGAFSEGAERDIRAEYKALAAAWKRVITERRSAA